ncbi:DUF5009 domain-containing protein [Pedobacter sp. AW31-3R]|uniref:DUF5009 domain-containing protein n=1 Tax=Pedobacter sp. AW31-3R TaxID=3445781 RepID=UPI003FA18FCD
MSISAVPVSRLISIDAFRASIMVLMIFVNDLWSLKEIPLWLEHVSAETDGMGLADIVFPAFLFIVGLSIPFAILNSRKKGNSTTKIFLHIVSRTTALLIMGLFLVNTEVYGEDAPIHRSVYTILLVIAFFLVWMAYKKPETLLVKVLKGLGISLLITLAFLYESNEATGITALGIHWWGILGLIGWAYFVSSCIFLFSNGKVMVQVVAMVFFIFICSASFLGWLAPVAFLKEYIWFAGEGAMPTFSMAGVLTSLAYKNLGANHKKFWILLFGFAFILIACGMVTRPLWGISKIRATPSWTTICSGIGVLSFLFTVYITDVKQITGWYKIVKPAGTSTLTSYLIPYVHYAIIGLVGIQLPLFLRTGYVGLGKSFIYALLIVTLTGLMEKKNIRLKI